MDEYGNLQDWVHRTGGGQPGSGPSGAGGPGGAAGSGSGVGGVSAGSGAGAGGVGSSSSAPSRRVVYGSTELLNAQDFLTEALAPLGQES